MATFLQKSRKVSQKEPGKEQTNFQKFFLPTFFTFLREKKSKTKEPKNKYKLIFLKFFVNFFTKKLEKKYGYKLKKYNPTRRENND